MEGIGYNRMGEAKTRGTREQRKAQAIAEGRVKTKPIGAHEKRMVEREAIQSMMHVLPDSYAEIFNYFRMIT